MTTDYKLIERLLEGMEHAPVSPTTLSKIATSLGLDPSLCELVLQRWAGVGAEDFLWSQSVDFFVRQLRLSNRLLERKVPQGLTTTIHKASRSQGSPVLSMVVSSGGREGLQILYGVHPSPFGPMFLAVSENAICFLAFLRNPSDQMPLSSLENAWRGAVFHMEADATASLARSVFQSNAGMDSPIKLLVRGSAFQIRVWRRLLDVPAGSVCSYQQLARAVGCPRGARAVGCVVAANPISYLIPCHRVIRNTGQTGEYRWGAGRKRAMLVWEATRRSGK
ncbi:MAG: methylated-DNA--[protein]-cysteine S-methyltransferase [Pseudomonadota bacterium]